MKKTLSTACLYACLTACLSLCLSACIFDKDDKLQHLDATFTGRLSNLTVLSNTGTVNLQWRLPVDTGDTRKLRGDCTYSGYLGDSGSVNQDSTAGLYTNTSMSGTKSASRWRAEGAILSVDSAHTTFTYYRADFACEY